MSTHPSEEQVNDFLDGVLPPEIAREVERHLEGCTECRAEAGRLRDLVARLGGLPEEATPERDLWPQIASRLAEPARPRRARLVLQMAAALALFAGGILVGRATKEPAAPEALRPAEEVQRTGSEYVAALATLGTARDPAERRQGREAALSALYGAAHELTRLDPEASGILTTVSTARSFEKKDDEEVIEVVVADPIFSGTSGISTASTPRPPKVVRVRF